MRALRSLSSDCATAGLENDVADHMSSIGHQDIVLIAWYESCRSIQTLSWLLPLTLPDIVEPCAYLFQVEKGEKQEHVSRPSCLLFLKRKHDGDYCFSERKRKGANITCRACPF